MAGVLVMEHAGVADGAEQEVVRQELQAVGLGVVLEAVHLDPALVVDVGVLFLRGREEELIVQEAHVARRLTDLHLTHQLALAPVHHRQVAACTAEQHVAPVPSKVHTVGPELWQAQVKRLARSADLCKREMVTSVARSLWYLTVKRGGVLNSATDMVEAVRTLIGRQVFVLRADACPCSLEQQYGLMEHTRLFGSG